MKNKETVSDLDKRTCSSHIYIAAALLLILAFLALCSHLFFYSGEHWMYSQFIGLQLKLALYPLFPNLQPAFFLHFPPCNHLHI